MTFLAKLKTIDLRVNLLLVVISTIAVVICQNELSFFFLMLVAVLWLSLTGSLKKAMVFFIAYGMLYLISYFALGINELTTLWLFSVIGRHVLILVAFISGVTNQSVGSFFAVFSKLHIPKAFSIATVVLLRFFPTIGSEYRAIKNALKFRGISISFWHTLTHPISTFEYVLIPMLIRTTRIAEELSAAAIVRGVGLDNQVVSYDLVEITAVDIVITCSFISFIILICLTDLFWEVMI